MATNVKFKSNLPEVMTFRFNQPKEWDSKFKPGEKTYSYGVEYKGEDAYMTATPTLHEKLQALSPLEGKTLEITKVEGENNRKFWAIKDALGNELTTKPQPKVDLEEKIREGFAKRDAKIAELEERILKLECEAEGEPYIPKVGEEMIDEIDIKDIPM